MSLIAASSGLLAAAVAGPTDPHFASVVSLLHFNGPDGSTTFTDQKGKVWTASGAAALSTSNAKYGTACGAFPGSTSAYIYTPSHSDFDFGSGDFSIDGWVRAGGTTPAYQGLIVRDQIGGTRGWLLYVSSSAESPAGGLRFAAWVGTTNYVVADTVALAVNTYCHVAVVRDGGALRLYKDGVQVGSTAISGSVGAPAEPCVIGSLWSVGAATTATLFTGRTDDFRINKGVCRYPGGTTFIPPAAQLPDS